jgi:hypothetical protein
LFGCPELHVYTDHKNLTFSAFQTQRVLRWRLFLEEFGPTFHYIEGSKNLAADALSRLPFKEEYNIDNNSFPKKFKNTDDSEERSSFFSIITDAPALLDCLVHLPEQQNVPFFFGIMKVGDKYLAGPIRLSTPSSSSLSSSSLNTLRCAWGTGYGRKWKESPCR